MVSVIVPNYNHARFLEQRLDSIFSQTFEEYEVILLDDLSTDNSVEVLSRYAGHPKVSHFVVNETNSGSSFVQWGKGILLAKGQYIWIAESDDWAGPDFLATMVSAMEQEDQISLAYCRINRMYGDGTFEEICRWGEAIDPERWDHSFVCSGAEAIRKYLLYRNIIVNGSAVLFRRDCALPYLEDIKAYRYCGDWVFWSLMLSEGKMAYVSEPLSYFRRYDGATSLKNVSRTITHRFLEYQRAIDRISALLPLQESVVEEQYDWIIREWMSKKEYMNWGQYLVCPPFRGMLRKMFYKQIVHQLWTQ